MGVLACDRRCCDHIMCDLLVDEKYICKYCAEEFSQQIGEELLTINEMTMKFRAFMDSIKFADYGNDLITVDKFLDNKMAR